MADRTGAFAQVKISEARYAELKSLVEPSQEHVATVRELFFGDEHHWPCPRCPRGQARKSRFVRRVHLKIDDEGYPHEEGFERDVKRTFNALQALGDPLNAAVQHVAFPALGIPSEDARVAARVYKCQQHGEFYLPLDEGEEPMVGRVWLPRDGRLEIARLRLSLCPGLIESVDAKGRTLRVEACARVMEWSGEM